MGWLELGLGLALVFLSTNSYVPYVLLCTNHATLFRAFSLSQQANLLDQQLDLLRQQLVLLLQFVVLLLHFARPCPSNRPSLSCNARICCCASCNAWICCCARWSCSFNRAMSPLNNREALGRGTPNLSRIFASVTVDRQSSPRRVGCPAITNRKSLILDIRHPILTQAQQYRMEQFCDEAQEWSASFFREKDRSLCMLLSYAPSISLINRITTELMMISVLPAEEERRRDQCGG